MYWAFRKFLMLSVSFFANGKEEKKRKHHRQTNKNLKQQCLLEL